MASCNQDPRYTEGFRCDRFYFQPPVRKHRYDPSV
jgi:hypothetical protein